MLQGYEVSETKSWSTDIRYFVLASYVVNNGFIFFYGYLYTPFS